MYFNIYHLSIYFNTSIISLSPLFSLSSMCSMSLKFYVYSD